MADEDYLILPPAGELAMLGATAEDVMQYPRMERISDKLGYAITDACRKSLVGVHGTNLQMLDEICNAGCEFEVLGQQVSLFLVKNRIKPTLSDALLLAQLAKETMDRLAIGDMHTVNRRAQLMAEGVLKPEGDDVVPPAVRNEWV